jgi:deoxyribodipyrimidine photo-lyase
MNNSPIGIFWFRRDLRVEDNHALYKALTSGLPILPIFIFDPYFFDKFPSNDRRFNLIYDRLKHLHAQLQHKLLILKAKPIVAFEQLICTYNIVAVYTNEDYEPFAIERDNEIATLLKKHNINLYLCKDQVIFHKNDILNNLKSLLPFLHHTKMRG